MIINRALSLVVQLVLAWNLLPRDFGVFSIYSGIFAISSLIVELGIGDLLVLRGESLRLWFKSIRKPHFVWSIFVATVTLIISKVAFEDVKVFWMLLISVPALILSSQNIGYYALLRSELNFKRIVKSKLISLFFSKSSLLLLVFLNAGVFSFAISQLVLSVGYYLLFRSGMVLGYSRGFDYTRLVKLVYVSRYNLFQSVAMTFVRNLDYLILASILTSTSLGIYFMSYSLSVQGISVFVLSVSPVFFPALTRYVGTDKYELSEKVLSIIKVFTVGGMIFAGIQFVFADILISTFLDDGWVESILLVRIMTVGLCFTIAATIWTTIYRINTDFRSLAITSLVGLLSQVFFVIIGGSLFGLVGGAIGVSVFNAVFSLFALSRSLSHTFLSPFKITAYILGHFVILCVLVLLPYMFLESTSALISIFVGSLGITIYFVLAISWDSVLKLTIMRVIENK